MYIFVRYIYVTAYTSDETQTGHPHLTVTDAQFLGLGRRETAERRHGDA